MLLNVIRLSETWSAPGGETKFVPHSKHMTKVLNSGAEEGRITIVKWILLWYAIARADVQTAEMRIM